MAENPWLKIPIEDYEAHMALPGIGQAQMLAEELARAVSQISARSIALVGCSGGNGIAMLPASVRRIVAIDINPTYVETLRSRFGGRSALLELFVADIQKGAPPSTAYCSGSDRERRAARVSAEARARTEANIIPTAAGPPIGPALA